MAVIGNRPTGRGEFLGRIPGVVADLNVYRSAVAGWLTFVVLRKDGSETDTLIPVAEKNLSAGLRQAIAEVEA